MLTVGYCRLQTSARCIPVTTPRRAANLCKSSPMMVATRRTHRSWEGKRKLAHCHSDLHGRDSAMQFFNLVQMFTLKPALAPDCRSDSMFPGSKYAMLIKNPGPVKAQSLRKLNNYEHRCSCFLSFFFYIIKSLFFSSKLFLWNGNHWSPVPGLHSQEWAPCPQSMWRTALPGPPEGWRCTVTSGLHSPEESPLQMTQIKKQKVSGLL